MTDAMKKRLLALVSLLVGGSALAYVSMSDLGESLVYYWTPTELLANQAKTGDAVVRLSGMVVDGTFQWDADAQIATFDLTDGKETVHVRSKGNPPQMFREGIGAVVEGQLAANVFETEKIMVKHSNEYEAPDGEVRVEEMYETLAVGEKN